MKTVLFNVVVLIAAQANAATVNFDFSNLSAQNYVVGGSLYEETSFSADVSLPSMITLQHVDGLRNFSHLGYRSELEIFIDSADTTTDILFLPTVLPLGNNSTGTIAATVTDGASLADAFNFTVRYVPDVAHAPEPEALTLILGAIGALCCWRVGR